MKVDRGGGIEVNGWCEDENEDISNFLEGENIEDNDGRERWEKRGTLGCVRVYMLLGIWFTCVKVGSLWCCPDSPRLLFKSHHSFCLFKFHPRKT